MKYLKQASRFIYSEKEEFKIVSDPEKEKLKNIEPLKDLMIEPPEDYIHIDSADD